MHDSGRHVITEEDRVDCQNIEMFLVTTKEAYDKLISLSAPDWFVADKMLLRNTFHRTLTLLAFDVDTVTDLMRIFKVLEMENRLVSQVSQRRIITEGDVTVDKDLSRALSHTCCPNRAPVFIGEGVVLGHGTR